MFWRNISTFDFDEKLTQSVAQIAMLYHESKDFLHLHFALNQFQGMAWKWKNAYKEKCWIKNMAVKIPNPNLAFVYFANFLLLLL